MHEEGTARLIAESVIHRYSRREVLRRAGALGLSAPSVALALQAESALAQDASNPLGGVPAAPLDVVVFQGGYGIEYAEHVTGMYNELYPEAEVSFTGMQRLGEQLQPRFVAGEPPDVVQNSGAGSINTAALVAEGQLVDLSDVLSAPSYDTEGAMVGETLVPGMQQTGIYGDTQYVLHFVVSVFGVWYSSSWMQEQGYTYPTTWTEMMDLCAELKGSGVASWMTTGVYPGYMKNHLFDQMLWKHEPQALVDLDNLEADAWKSPAVQDVLEALSMLYQNEYIGEGWEGLTHTESQAEWLQGRGIFLPCGSWLENEMEGLVPEGFDMVVAATPSLQGDTIPFEGIFSAASMDFIVPTQGENVQGGKEWLRLLVSKEAGRVFSESGRALSVVQASAEGLELGTAFASTQQVLRAAGEHIFSARYPRWYADLQEAAQNQLGALLQGQIDIQEFMDSVQEVADEVKDDEAIPKYQREL